MSRRRSRQQVPKSLTYSKVDELMASPTEPLDESRCNHQLLRIYQVLRDLDESEKQSVEG